MANVTVIPCDTYEYGALREAVERILEKAGGADRFFRPGVRVLLKPNLVAKRRPDLSVTTHPVLVEAVARAAIDRGASVLIADSPGGTYNKGVLKRLYEICGMEQAALSCGAQLNYDVTEKDCPMRGEMEHLHMPIIQPVLDADVIVNLPKLKTHTMTYLSGCVKNLFGTVAGVFKTQFHYKFTEKTDFCNMLVDLCEFVKPQLHVVDAVDAMEGNGPSNGKIRHLGLILGGENPYAIDDTAAEMMGFSRGDILTLANALRRGLYDPAEITVAGPPGGKATLLVQNFQKPDTYAVDFSKNIPPFLVSALRGILKPAYPRFSKARCIGCETCLRACPANALTMRDGLPILRKEACIKCYCCQELCPKDAILLEKRFLKLVNHFKVGI